jgi:hypothetical protein
MSVRGIRDLSVPAPIGTVKARVEVRRRDGLLTGAAHRAGEQVPLGDLLEGERPARKQAGTERMRTNPPFDVTIQGSDLPGTSRAGGVTSLATGRRRTVRIAGEN